MDHTDCLTLSSRLTKLQWALVLPAVLQYSPSLIPDLSCLLVDKVTRALIFPPSSILSELFGDELTSYVTEKIMQTDECKHLGYHTFQFLCFCAR